MRVLIVEPDGFMAARIEATLRAHGFGTEVAALGEDALELVALYAYDAIVLETKLPDMSGLEVIRRLRSSSKTTPVVIVSEDAAPEAKVKHLDAGADDYLTKPVSIDELIARIRAVSRRLMGRAENKIAAGKLTINLSDETVSVDGNTLHFTRIEYAILAALAERPGRAVSKPMIVEMVYGGRDMPAEKIVDVFICRIRQKLARAGAPGHIATVWGRGLAFNPEPGLGEVDQQTLATKRREALLEALANGPLPFSGVYAAMQPIDGHTLRTVISRALREGVIVNRGRPREAIYAIAGVSARVA